MIILEPAESFKTMNQPDPTVTLFHGSYLGNFKRLGREISTQSLFDTLICVIKIWHRYF